MGWKKAHRKKSNVNGSVRTMVDVFNILVFGSRSKCILLSTSIGCGGGFFVIFESYLNKLLYESSDFLLRLYVFFSFWPFCDAISRVNSLKFT